MFSKITYHSQEIKPVRGYKNKYFIETVCSAYAVHFTMNFFVQEEKNKAESVSELDVSITDEQHSKEINEWVSDCIEHNDIQRFLMGVEEYGMLSKLREDVVHCLPSEFFSVERSNETGEYTIVDTSSDTQPLFSATWRYRWFIISQHFLPDFEFSIHPAAEKMEEELLVYIESLTSTNIYQVPEMITSCWKNISEIVVKYLKKHKASYITHEAKRKKKHKHYGTTLSAEQYARVEKELRRMFCNGNDNDETVN